MASSNLSRRLLTASTRSSVFSSTRRIPRLQTRALSSLPRLLPQSHSSLFTTPQSQAKRINQLNSFRAFTTSLARSEQKPQAGAYIASGILDGNKGKLVDVKKVLVIGSGGLSIGQAGEFDYSGTQLHSIPIVAMS